MCCKLHFRTKYDPCKVSKSFKNVKGCTDQQFADMCSVEQIIKRYGILPKPSVPAIFADVSEIGSYQECHQRVGELTEYFEGLPSELRDRFKQSPDVFFTWLADPANRAEAVKIGIFEDNAPDNVEKLLGEIAENTKVIPPKE